MTTISPNQTSVGSSGIVQNVGRVSPIGLKRNGALPFKKRKLAHVITSPVPTPAQKHNVVAPSSVPALDDERSAAMALLAAASRSFSKASKPASLSGSLMALSEAAEAAERTISPPNVTLGSFDLQVCQPIGPSPVTPVTPMGTIEIVSFPLSSNNSVSSKLRMHRPPLASPLPGGCHGRTSRNNSFCRRTPCYNASNYCKLHYQQYVVAGSRVPVKIDADSINNSLTSTPVSTAHQDKRFTGCGDEVRCAAVTTRGRACAYVSVEDTKYCHLHSDYATNPPPRRGGGSSCSKPRLVSKGSLDIFPRVQGCPAIPDLGSRKQLPSTSLKPTLVPLGHANFRVSTPSLSVSSEESIIMSTGIQNGSNAQGTGHVLLSAISSEQWLNRKVLIATGPLANRTGIVEKWGNGWVTVRVHDGLTHNRRSVELFLLPDGASHSSSEAPSSDNDKNGLPHSVSFVKNGNQEPVSTNGPAAQRHPYLSHSVSFDTVLQNGVTVSPSHFSSDTPIMSELSEP